MAAQQKVKIDLPPGFDDRIKERIGLDIISFIQERAIERNTGFNAETGRNKKFPPYTKAYADKKGTSEGNVDLILSAEMFNAMKVLRKHKDSIVIGFEAGSDQNGKAEGNQIGSYGRDPNPKKARPFLGLTQADLNRILEKYKD